MKALAKDRGRRYETANGLARDVQHYLDDEPVEARPPSWTDQMARWKRRHPRVRTALTIGKWTSLAVALLGTIAYQFSQSYSVKEKYLQRSRQEREAYSSALAFVTNAFVVGGPQVAPEQAKPFLDAVLKYAAERADIKGMLEQQAGELVHHELARGFEALHDDAHAETQWRRAIELAGRSNLEAPIGQFELVRDATAWRRHSLAVGLRRQGKLAEAEQELREVLSAIARIEQEEKNRGSKLVGVGAEELSLSSTLAKVLADEQRPGEAATVLRAALEKTVVRTHDGYGVAVPSGFATLFAKRELTSYQSKSTLARHWEHLGQLYESAGQPEKAAEWRGKLEAQSAVKP